MEDTIKKCETSIEKDFIQSSDVKYLSDEEIEMLSLQIIEKFHDVYEVLAQ